MDYRLDLTPDDLGALDRVARRIPAHIRERSRSYANGRRIASLRRRGTTLLADIEGTSVYEVEIDLKKAKADCSCPAPKPCKHIAALSVYAAAVGAEQPLFGDAPEQPRAVPGEYRLRFFFPPTGAFNSPRWTSATASSICTSVF